MQALVFVYLSWTDPRARKAVAANAARMKANSSEACKFQCQLYPKDQQSPTQGCCDNVWVSVGGRAVSCVVKSPHQFCHSRVAAVGNHLLLVGGIQLEFVV